MTVKNSFLAAIAAMLVAVSALDAAAQDFRPITIDGSTTASGQAASVVYNSGTYHLWYRNDSPAGEIGGLNYATSSNGVNFVSQGPLSFNTDPFSGGVAPYLYYENVSLVGGDYKIQHWTYNGGDGSFPDYNYNISVSDAGSSPSTTVDHQGPIGGGTIGQTAGSFGIVGGYLYMQGGNGRELVRAAYTDGNPPTVSSLTSVANFDSLFTSLGIGSGYINNHSDVVDMGGGNLGFVFTLRDGSGSRFDQQLYGATSSDNGATWSSAFATLTSPTLEGGSFGAGGFAHADVVNVNGTPIGYFSAQDALGNYIIATNAVPEPGSVALMGLAGLFGTAVYLRRRWA